jgi:hypothetical protein
MSLANRLELKRLCHQIEALVKSEDLDFGYNQGGVRVSVMSGKKAETYGTFVEAMKTFRSAARRANGDELAKAKEEFVAAFLEYAEKMGY